MSSTNVKDLVFQIAKRNIYLKYKGSILGVFWSFLNPLFLLAVYTFIFGFAFKTKWGGESLASYPIILFSGLIFHFFIIELLSSSSQLISGNANYVKKVVFPLEVLVISNFLSQIFNLLIGAALLSIAVLVTGGNIFKVIFALVIVLPPFMILTLGISYLFSSLGAFIKDITHVVNLASTLFLFVSPILFPMSVFPDVVKWIVYLNPVSLVVIEYRAIAFHVESFSVYGYAAYCTAAFVIFLLGRWVFNRLSRGFADVV
ncbi:ABC transporter permease [[Enterobacter] lignolyticus]|uniref:Transport permease protein n=1 Tax=Enterobacter lignolyticus (strain SCF1) TaxID=701347 RepID=E3GCY3_ENTLS|nr:ABC transporter permease [[Enterobacter] lignolyticus]ADO47913.1 ABC-2 type transporter [[Enterobacter] lignolyticus SCF1]